MAEVKWFKITPTLFDDEKIRFIENEKKTKADTIIVIWFKLLCLAGKLNSRGYLKITDKIPYTEELLADYVKRDIKIVKMALNIFRDLAMIHYDNGTIVITNWEKYQNVDGMEKIKQQNKERQARHRAKKNNVTNNVTNNGSITLDNETESDIESDIEREVEIRLNDYLRLMMTDINKTCEILGFNTLSVDQWEIIKSKWLTHLSVSEILKSVEKAKRNNPKNLFAYTDTIIKELVKVKAQKSDTPIDLVDYDWWNE